jgi:hypothetical protein
LLPNSSYTLTTTNNHILTQNGDGEKWEQLITFIKHKQIPTCHGFMFTRLYGKPTSSLNDISQT